MDDNLILYAASYADATTAEADFESLKRAQSAGEFDIQGAVVASRDLDGKMDVKEHGHTATGAGAVLGGTTGLVIGLFAPPLLLATAVGAAIGAGIGAMSKHGEEKQMGAELEEYLPPGSSAVIVLAEDKYVDGIDKALAKSTRKIRKTVSTEDYDELEKALSDAGYDISGATGS